MEDTSTKSIRNDRIHKIGNNIIFILDINDNIIIRRIENFISCRYCYGSNENNTGCLIESMVGYDISENLCPLHKIKVIDRDKNEVMSNNTIHYSLFINSFIIRIKRFYD